MFIRPLSLLFASLACMAGLAAHAAPAVHRPEHSRASGTALIVRGDQVSTEGLVDAVAKAFAETREGHLEVTPFNTIAGIDDALNGTVDVAAVARPAYPGRSQESGLIYKPVAWDALVLIANAANPVRNLTLKQVHGIYYGKITNWSEVGGPNQHIDLEGVFPKLDGVQFSFRRLLFGNGDYPVAVPRLLINIDSLQSDVALNPKGLALSTLAHARRQKGIKIIPIEGVMPSVATLEDATYPLPLKIYLAYKADNPKISTIRQFLTFLGGHRVGAILRSHGLLPFAQAAALNVSTELDRINMIGARMMAEGLPPAYAPANEAARLASKYPELTRQLQLREGASGAESASGGATEYTVANGDTLATIASSHAVTVADLRKWNHLHGDAVHVGQTLKVSAVDP